MYGHMSTYRLLPPRYPQYFERAEGCRLWDADGNEYIDFMCSFGPMIAGYGNPRIRAAADAQRDRLDIANGPPALIVDLAERFVRQVGHAEWAIFAKNGNDATTVCNMVARARSEKRKILVAEGAYHGAAPWANRMSRGTPAEDHVHFPTYRYNDVASLDAASRAAASLSAEGKRQRRIPSRSSGSPYLSTRRLRVVAAQRMLTCWEQIDVTSTSATDGLRGGRYPGARQSWSATAGTRSDTSRRGSTGSIAPRRYRDSATARSRLRGAPTSMSPLSSWRIR